MHKGGSATLDVGLRISGVAVEYLQDLKEAQGVVPDGSSVFIPKEIRSYFDELPGVTPADVTAEGPGDLHVKLEFEDISGFFSSDEIAGIPNIISLDRSGEGEILRISFQRDNMPQLMNLMPFGEDPVSQSGLMLFEGHGTKEEFRQMILWLFEEYAPPGEIGAALDASTLELTVMLPRPVKKTDMKKLTDNKLHIAVPIAEFFTLESPVSFFAEY